MALEQTAMSFGGAIFGWSGGERPSQHLNQRLPSGRFLRAIRTPPPPHPDTMPMLAPLIPFIPLIAAGVGAGTALYSGAQANRRNDQALGQANQATAQQQQLIGQLMSGISPEAYRAQAYQDGQSALGQLSSNFAQRGMLSSGALHSAGNQTLSKLYADASTRYQQDRQNAIGMALGGQQQIQRQYGAQVNPDPYAGLGTALGAIGTAGGQYLYNQQRATPTPGAGLPGFSVTYPRKPTYP